MIPSFDDSPPSLVHGSAALQGGYILLPKQDHHAVYVTEHENQAIATYLQEPTIRQKVCRWGRLQLPNGQVARSVYVEQERPGGDICMARNIKVKILFS